ncbi:MAG: hypothetical protein ACYCPP_02190 [Nitrososphaerales archaeon]
MSEHEECGQGDEFSDLMDWVDDHWQESAEPGLGIKKKSIEIPEVTDEDCFPDLE